MTSRVRAAVFAVALVFMLAGCKERIDISRPLPAPEPPATAALTPPRDDLAAPSPKKRPSADDEVAPTKPKQPSGDDAPKAPSAAEPTTAAGGTAATTGAATGGSVAGGSPTTTPTSVPTLAAPSAACLTRCQSSMQACLSQPVDGGVPGFANLDLCKNAFAACQNACK